MATHVPLQSVTLTSTATQVLFSNIPQDYTDLIIRGSYTLDMDDLPFVRFASNSAIDSGTNYGYRYMRASSSAATGGGAANIAQIYLTYSLTGQSNFTTHLNSYSNTNVYKTIMSRGNDGTSNGVLVYVGEWRNTGAITAVSVQVGNSGASFQSGSTFDLYGIKAGTPKAIGGDLITTNGTYWYHTFKTSGTFTVQQDSALSIDYLVVAGGGAGGVSGGGGGGAGGLRSTVTATGGGGSLESAVSLIGGTTYTITVGAGGSGSSTNQGSTGGSNSSITGGNTSIVSIGGGRGAGYTTASTVGGSGGGGSGHNASPGDVGAAGTTNQGYKGGNSGSGGAGGGGGAGAAASNAGTNSSTAGGAGVAVSITGSSVTYAGGGGGGGWYNPTTNGASGGSGGGGAGGNGGGSTGYNATSATANTGGGGGGGGAGSAVDGQSGSGGSGIVIVRYAV